MGKRPSPPPPSISRASITGPTLPPLPTLHYGVCSVGEEMGIRLDLKRWGCGDGERWKTEMWVLFVDICLVEFESPNLRVNTRVEPKNQYLKSRRALESKVNQFQSWICHIFLNLFVFLFFSREKRKMQCTIPSTYDFHVLFSSPEETPLRNWGMTQWGPNHRKKGAARNVEGDPELGWVLCSLSSCLGELDAFTRKSLCGLLIYISFPRLKKYIFLFLFFNFCQMFVDYLK